MDYLAEYCARTERRGLPGHTFFAAFSLFRWAAIWAGIYRRALDGNAADAEGLKAGETFKTMAELGWDTTGLGRNRIEHSLT